MANLDTATLVRLAAFLQAAPSASSSHVPSPQPVQTSVVQQNLLLQHLIGMPAMPSSTQVMLDLAKQQADSAYQNALRTYENAQAAAVQAQATQLLTEQLVREMLMKQIAEATTPKQQETVQTKEDVKNKGGRAEEEASRLPDPAVQKHNEDEQKTDDARRLYEKKRRAEDESTTKREQDRARQQAAGQDGIETSSLVCDVKVSLETPHGY